MQSAYVRCCVVPKRFIRKDYFKSRSLPLVQQKRRDERATLSAERVHEKGRWDVQHVTFSNDLKEFGGEEAWNKQYGS